MNQEPQPRRMMNEAVAIEQSRDLNKPSRSFEEKLVTEDDVKDEMTYTMINCTEIKPK